MNNVELSDKIKGYLKSAASKAKKFEDTVAVTVSLISEENEDMYVAVREGMRKHQQKRLQQTQSSLTEQNIFLIKF